MEIRDIKRKLAYVLSDEQVRKIQVIEYRNKGILGLPDGGLMGIKIKTKTQVRDHRFLGPVREEIGVAIINPRAAAMLAAQIGDDNVNVYNDTSQSTIDAVIANRDNEGLSEAEWIVNAERLNADVDIDLNIAGSVTQIMLDEMQNTPIEEIIKQLTGE